MKNIVLTLVVSAACVSACGEATNTPTSQVPAQEAKSSKNDKMTPPKARMNFLIGRSLAIKKAMPAQMDGKCDTVAKIRNNKMICSQQINAIAKTANFKPKDCSQIDAVVTCKGIVDTDIGSARVVAAFQKVETEWQGKIKNIVDGTWKRKN